MVVVVVVVVSLSAPSPLFCQLFVLFVCFVCAGGQANTKAKQLEKKAVNTTI